MMVAWFLLLIAVPKAAACAVCGVYGQDPSAGAFLEGTALLSLAPMAMIGGTVYYLVRLSRRASPVEGPTDVVDVSQLAESL